MPSLRLITTQFNEIIQLDSYLLIFRRTAVLGPWELGARGRSMLMSEMITLVLWRGSPCYVRHGSALVPELK